jgi:riboflavin biosynthesis pyrimidine reductase
VQFDISTLLLEGGAALHAAAWRAQLIDRVHVIVTPKMLGEGGVPSFEGIVIPMSELAPIKVEQLGPDQWMEADVHGHR